MTANIIGAIASDPKLARKLKAPAKRADGLVWAKAQTFAAEAGAVLVEVGITGPRELEEIDFETVRKIIIKTGANFS